MTIPSANPGTNGQSTSDPVVIGLKAQFEQLVAQNRAAFEELARQGIQLDMGTMVMGMVECLYDTLGEIMGPQQGPQFVQLARLRWEQRTAANIAQARNEGRKAQLTLGGSLSPAMIRDLARATGTYGA